MELTSTLIEQLAEASSELPYSADKVCLILSEIGETGDISAVHGIYPLLSSHLKKKEKTGTDGLLVRLNLVTKRLDFVVPAEVLAAAVSTIARLMSKVRDEQIPNVDLKLRGSLWSWWGISPIWSKWAAPVSPDPSIVVGLPGATLVLGALSMNRSGYVRESAVGLLREHKSSEGFPFLLWRTADWVPEVQELAAIAVQELLADGSFIADFIRALPLLDRLDRIERTDLSNVTRLIRNRLVGEDSQTSLRMGLKSGSQRVRRCCVELLGRVQPVPAFDIIEHVASLPDVLLRRHAIQWEPRLRPVDPELARALRIRFLHDKSAILRVLALRAEIDAADQVSDLLDLLWRCTSDEAIAVRECARYYITRHDGSADFAGHYRSLLASNDASSLGALAGLGETGTQTDYNTVMRYLNGPPLQKTCAIRALVRLDPGRIRDVALASLLDQNKHVRQAALDTVGRRITDQEAQILIARISDSINPGIENTLLILANRVEEWQSLDILLSLSIATSSSKSATDILESWSPKGLYRPRRLSKPEQEALRSKLSTIEGRLTSSAVDRLVWYIDGSRRNP